MPTGSQDRNNVVTKTIYDDPFNRPTLIKSALGVLGIENHAAMYYAPANVFGITLTNNDVLTVHDQSVVDDATLRSWAHTDGFGRTTETWSRDPQGDGKVVSLYDALGRASQTSNPFRPSLSESPMYTSRAYDLAGRVSSVTTPDNAVITTGYVGNAVTVTDQAGKKRRSITDGLSRLTRVDEPDANNSLGSVTSPFQPTSYYYDLLGNLTTVSQGGQQRYFMYDSLSRLSRARNPEQDVNSSLNWADPLTGNSQWSVAYQYDNNGNLLVKTDARGVSTHFSYDALNRAGRRWYNGSSLLSATSNNSPALPAGVGASHEVNYSYDAAGVPNSKGWLTSVTSSVSSYSYSGYDALGRVLGGTQTTDTQDYPMSYSYDLAGNMVSQTYPSGRVVTSEYDLAGRLAGVKNQASGLYYAGAAATDSTNRIQYSAHGATSNMRLGNGLWEHTNFNSQLQPTQIGLGTASTNSSVLQLDYNYGTTANNGNVLSQTITVPTIGVVTGFTATQTYTYDALNRLATAQENPGASWTQNFSYDRYGNRNFAGGTTLPAPLSASNNPVINPNDNRIDIAAGGQISYSYDGAGNLTHDATVHAFGYDAENKQTTYDGGATANGGATYSYDGDGRRVKKVVGGPTLVSTVFVYNVAGQLVAEYSNASPSEPGGTSYLTSDTLGSPRVITGPSQGVKARHDYRPFGEELDTGTGGRTSGQGYVGDTVRQKFTSKERDIETGLDYFLARYYSSTQGRFTSPDEFAQGPLEVSLLGRQDSGKQALAYADIFSPQSLNKYHSCLNNPLRYIDPDGHDWRIVEEKDKDGKLVNRYVWDSNYTYKKGDKNGAPPDARYIDTQGRAIQLWGSNSKDPKEEQTHGYQVVTADSTSEDVGVERLTDGTGAAPTSYANVADTEKVLLQAGYKHLSIDPFHSGTQFFKETGPTLHISVAGKQAIVEDNRSGLTTYRTRYAVHRVEFHADRFSQVKELGAHMKEATKQFFGVQ